MHTKQINPIGEVRRSTGTIQTTYLIAASSYFVGVSVCLRKDATILRIERGGELSGDLRRLLLIELEGILRALSEELQHLRSQSVLPFTKTRVTYDVRETEGVHGGYLS